MAQPTPGFVEAGSACAELIANPKAWINRRVETVEMLSREETRRRVSIDFTLPDGQRAKLTTRHGLTVPISVLTKAPAAQLRPARRGRGRAADPRQRRQPRAGADRARARGTRRPRRPAAG